MNGNGSALRASHPSPVASDAVRLTRAIREIQRDLDVALGKVAELRIEKAAAWTAQRQGIVRAFDDGATRQQIMEAFDVTYQYVANILLRAGRNERQRAVLRAAAHDDAVARIAAEAQT